MVLTHMTGEGEKHKGGSTGSPIRLNELETGRFGVACANVVLRDGALPEIREIEWAAQSAGTKLLTARLDANRLGDVRALEAAGFRLMDTLVYYARPLEALPPAPRTPEGTAIRPGTPDDAESVSAIARQAFRGYMGHYHADPRLDDDTATEAYADWAGHSAKTMPPEGGTSISVTGSRITGFLAFRMNAPSEVELTLSGIDGQTQRRGLYAALFWDGLRCSRALGATKAVTSTQLNNYAVQRVWSRFGFVHERSYYTLHKWFDRS